jgi:MFS family permease
MFLKILLALVALAVTVNRGSRLLLALYALKLGAQPLAVGILAATFAIFPTTLSWPIGMLVDRFGARWTLALGSACLIVGAIVPYFFPVLTGIFVAAGLIGLATAFHNVSLHNLIGLLSKPDERTQNYATYSLALAISAFVGPLLVGFGIDHLGHETTGLYLALLAAAPVVAPVIWGGVLPGGTRDTATPRGNILHTLKDRDMLQVLATGSLAVGGMELFQFYMPIYMHSIGLSASATGVVLAAFGAAAFVIRLIMRAVLTRLTELELLAYSFYISAATLVLIPFVQNVSLLALLAFTYGLGMGCGQPITMSLTFRNSAKGRSGEVLGLRIAINQGTRVVVPVVFGSIGSAFGLFPVFWIFALMLGSGGMLSRDKTTG